MIKQIYFDFGAVLVNYERALQTMCRDFSLDFDEFMKFFQPFDDDLILGKIRTVELWQKCIDKYNLKDADKYDILRSWVSDYDIIKPLNKLIYTLEPRIDMGIISNVGSGLWEAAVKYKMVPDIKYKFVFLSYQHGIIKPEKKVYEMAQKAAGVKATEILFVDDNKDNIIAANEFGWQTVRFDRFHADEGVEKIKEIINAV